MVAIEAQIRAAFLVSEPLSIDVVSLCGSIIADYDLTPETLFDKWEAYAMANNVTAKAPSVADLRRLREDLKRAERKEESARKKTPRIRRHTPGTEFVKNMTPVKNISINDFFDDICYLDFGTVRGNGARNDESDDQFEESDDMDTSGGSEDADEGKEIKEEGALPDREQKLRRRRKDLMARSGVMPMRIDSPKKVLDTDVYDFQLPGDDDVDAAYNERADIGRVEATWNCPLPEYSREVDVQVEILEDYSAPPPKRPFRYMNEDLPTRADAVRERIRTIGGAIMKNLRKTGKDVKVAPESYFTPSTEVVFALGRIRCELDETDGSGGRINLQSVLLESEEGSLVKLDLARVAKQAVVVVPGMIVVVEGVNINGRIFQVHAMYDDASTVSCVSKDRMEISGGDGDGDQHVLASVIIAAGPYTTSANLKFEALEDLLAVIRRSKPHVAVLMGPFLPENHKYITSEEYPLPVEYEKLFESRVIERIGSIPDTHFVILPALDDVHHDFVAPQPPFPTVVDAPSIYFASNPSVVRIATKDATREALLGATSLPTITDISGDCICVGKPDRFAALASHVLRQRSFYPICPPSPNVPLDTTFSKRINISLDAELDVLVLPSKLKAFLKEVDGGGLCVNPGFLCKGKGGGTYCEIRIPLLKKPDDRNGNLSAISATVHAEIYRI